MPVEPEAIDITPKIEKEVTSFVELPKEQSDIFTQHVANLLAKKGHTSTRESFRSIDGPDLSKEKLKTSFIDATDPDDHTTFFASLDSDGVIVVHFGSALRRKSREDVLPSERFTFYPDGRIHYQGSDVPELSDDIQDRFDQFVTNFERVERYASGAQRARSLGRRMLNFSLFTREK
ncbi:MAG: hypothetical protein WCI60_05125 [bacterium]|jgi:hypothetical protein